jgi:uncharacterized Fe-S cluster-containing protein
LPSFGCVASRASSVTQVEHHDEDTNRKIHEQNRLKEQAEARIKTAESKKSTADLEKQSAASQLQALHDSRFRGTR